MAKRSYVLWGLTLLIGLTVLPALADLTHRYNFNGDPNDKIGTADGVVVNRTPDLAYYVDGQLNLGNNGSQGSDGTTGAYVDLPNGMIRANGNQATFEFWLTWGGPTTSNWQEFMSFGTSNAGEGSSGGAGNSTYIMFTPRSGADNPANRLRFGYRYGLTANEQVLDHSVTMPEGQQKHIVASWDGANGVVTMYVDGQFSDSGAIHFDLSNPAHMIDNNNWLGRSQWPDTLFVGSYNEFRIYNHALSADEVAANYVAGPDAMPPFLVAPTPDGAYIGATSTTLEWAPALVLPGTLVEYDVYLGTDQAQVAAATTADLTGIFKGSYASTITTYPTGTLDINSTYWWRVDQRTIDDPCTVPGPLWHFDTLRTLANLTGPADTRVLPGEDAEFVVAIDSDTPVTDCQWKKVKDSVTTDLEDDDDYDITCGDEQATLVIKTTTLDDEADYYCVVTNAAGPATSDTANLNLKLVVAHYEMETAPDPNVPDSSGFNHTGQAMGDPALVAGKVGSGAYDFDGDDNVQIPVEAITREDFTIMAWVKTTQSISGTGAGWWTGAGIVNGEMPGGVDDYGMQLLGSKASAAVSNAQVASASDINDGAWHHVAFTRDSATGVFQLYVDGRMEAQATGMTGPLNAPTNLQIGKQQTGTGYLIGQIDDVILRDYVMEPLEIADEVYTVTNEPVCTGDVEYDFNNDCQVDLKDFAIFAERWLNCKWYPQCFE
ncbi:MAG: hypothetical protein JW810_00475 [Sedimentisphaerales bacterium]|nr:hypothetical protein [Sedimentisphaerales bacterium]